MPTATLRHYAHFVSARDTILTAAPADLSWDGQALALPTQIVLTPGAVTWVGETLVINATLILTLDPESLAWTGLDLTIVTPQLESTLPAGLAWTGQPLGINESVRFPLAPAATPWTGQGLTVNQSTRVQTSPAATPWTGLDLFINAAGRLQLVPAAMPWTGQAIHLRANVAIVLLPAARVFQEDAFQPDAFQQMEPAMVWTGQALIINESTRVATAPANLQWTGQPLIVPIIVALDVPRPVRRIRISTPAGTKAIAHRALDQEAVFYEAALLRQPVAQRALRDELYGILQTDAMSFEVAAGILAVDAPETLRGRWVSMDRYDVDTRVAVPEWNGVVDAARLAADGSMQVSAVNLDVSILERQIPSVTVETTVWAKAIDAALGKTIPVIFGNVAKVPILLVRYDVQANVYDYIVAHGAVTVAAAYRNGPNESYYPIACTECLDAAGQPAATWAAASRTDIYAGYTTLRFPVPQLDFSGGHHRLFASVYGLQTERNFARAIQTILTNATWGLGKTVDVDSFNIAANLLDAVGGLYCDGALTKPVDAQTVLEHLLMARGMRLGTKPESTNWTIAVDIPASVVLDLYDGPDDGDRNVLDLNDRYAPNLASTVSELRLAYRESMETGQLLFTQKRSLQAVGKPQTLENLFVRDHTTADKICDYLGKRILAAETRTGATVTLDAVAVEEGDLVRLTYALYGFSAREFQVIEVERELDVIRLGLHGHDATAFSYVPGTLPPDPDTGDLTDYSRTGPSPATNLTAAGGGTEVGLDGMTVAYVTLTYNLPSVNVAHAIIQYRRNGTTEWTTGGVVTTTSPNPITAKVSQLLTKARYDFTVVVISRANLPSLNNPVLTNVETAHDEVAPNAPTGLTSTVGTGLAVALDWADNIEADFSEYRVYRRTDTLQTPTKGGSDLLAEVRASRFVDTGSSAHPMALGTPYYYWISALDRSENESDLTGPIIGTPSGAAQGTAPSKPTPAPSVNQAGSGTYQGDDGTTLAYVTLNLPAMPANGAYLNVLMRTQALVPQPWAIADQRDVGSGTCRIDDLTPSHVYEFACIAYNAFGRAGTLSDIVTHTAARDTGAPATPTWGTPAITPGPGTLTLDWADNTEDDLDEYWIYRNTVPNIPATTLAHVSASFFVDTSVDEGQLYYYWLKAVDRSENVSAASVAQSGTATGEASGAVPGTPAWPGNWFANYASYQGKDGTTWAAVTLNAPPMPPNAAYLNILYQRVTVPPATTWKIGNQLAAGSVAVRIDDLATNTAYKFAAQAFGSLGRASEIGIAGDVTTPFDSIAPATPGTLTAEAGTGNAVLLDWPDNTEADLAEYRIKRRPSGGAWAVIGKVRASRWVDAGLVLGTTYEWTVEAIDLSGNVSGISNIVSKKPTGAAQGTTPGTPAVLVFSSEDIYFAKDGTCLAYLTLTVPAFPAETAYLNILMRTNGAGAPWTVVDQRSAAGGTTRIDDLTPNHAYDFACQAYNAFGQASPVGAILTRTTKFQQGQPAVPTGLTATAGTGLSVTLDWNDNTTDADLAEYGVYRYPTNSPSQKLLLAKVRASRFVDAGGPGAYALTLNDDFYYWVTAINRSGVESNISAVASATPTGAAQGAAPARPEGVSVSPPEGPWQGLYPAADGTMRVWMRFSCPLGPDAAYANVLVKEQNGPTGAGRVADQITTNGQITRVDDLTPGVGYYVFLKAFNAFGQASEPGGSLLFTASGDGEAPPPAFAVTARQTGAKVIEIAVGFTHVKDWAYCYLYRDGAAFAKGKQSIFHDENVGDINDVHWYSAVIVDTTGNQSAMYPAGPYVGQNTVTVEAFPAANVGPNYPGGNITPGTLPPTARTPVRVWSFGYQLNGQLAFDQKVINPHGLGTTPNVTVATGSQGVLAWVIVVDATQIQVGILNHSGGDIPGTVWVYAW